MIKVIYEYRTIADAALGKPFLTSIEEFRYKWTAHLFCLWINLMGPGADYEGAWIDD